VRTAGSPFDVDFEVDSTSVTDSSSFETGSLFYEIDSPKILVSDSVPDADS